MSEAYKKVIQELHQHGKVSFRQLQPEERVQEGDLLVTDWQIGPAPIGHIVRNNVFAVMRHWPNDHSTEL